LSIASGASLRTTSRLRRPSSLTSTLEQAALRWLERYLTEGSPRLQHLAEVAASLANRDVDAG
jgi:hypothetical protein